MPYGCDCPHCDNVFEGPLRARLLTDENRISALAPEPSFAQRKSGYPS